MNVIIEEVFDSKSCEVKEINRLFDLFDVSF